MLLAVDWFVAGCGAVSNAERDTKYGWFVLSLKTAHIAVSVDEFSWTVVVYL